MNKTKILIVLLIINLQIFCKAQTKQYDVGNFTFSHFVSKNYYERFHTVKELPDTIKQMLISQIQAKTGKYFQNFSMQYCDIIDVERFLTDFPDSLNQNFLPIPKYLAVFDWRDTSIGVKKYSFQALMDQYGQFIYLGFPRSEKEDKHKFMTYHDANQSADSIIANDTIKYDDKDLYLYFDLIDNDLKWNIIYTKANYRRKDHALFRTLCFSLKKHALISDNKVENDFVYFQF